MPDPVVVVADEPQVVAEPVKNRHLSVGVVPANHQHDCVQKNQKINEARELEPPIGCGKDSNSQDCRQDFKEPGEIVMRMDARPGEHSEQAGAVNDDFRFIAHGWPLDRTLLPKFTFNRNFAGRAQGSRPERGESPGPAAAAEQIQAGEKSFNPCLIYPSTTSRTYPRMSWNKSSPRWRPPYLSLLASSSTNWLDLVHVPSTIPQWYESVGEFISAHRYTFR